MKVLITGATGALGTAVTEALLGRGDEVVGLTRNAEKAKEKQAAVTWHGWEPTLERPPAAAFEGVDGVINLIGEKIDQRWTDSAKERIMESRRTATRNLVGAISGLEAQPQVLVSQSAIGYYGDHGDEVLDESDTGGSGDFAAEVVGEWEAAAREIEGTGVRLAIVRTGLVLDPENGMLKRLLPPFKLGVGGPLAGGDQYMSWVHVDDAIAVLLWALDNERVEGVVNSTAPDPVTNRDFSKALGRALHRPAVMPVPGFALDAILGREAAEHTAKSSIRVMPKRTQELGYEFKHPELDAALSDLL
jgi:uncharacterized protein (TIGR01777 family)